MFLAITAKSAAHVSSPFVPVRLSIPDEAKKNGVVLVDGVGFGAKPGELRVSQANLPTDDYALIGKQVMELLKEYHEEYEKKQNK